MSSTTDDLDARVLYRLLELVPAWSARPVANDINEPQYQVQEHEYLTQQLKLFSSSYTAQETIKQTIKRTILSCKRRRDPVNHATNPSLQHHSDDDSHWSTCMSPSGSMVAIIGSHDFRIRSSLSHFAWIDCLIHPLNPYIHSQSPYAAQQSAEFITSDEPPFTRYHGRPAAWSACETLLAIATNDDTVEVYEIDPITLNHSGEPSSSARMLFSFSTNQSSSPLEWNTLQLQLPILQPTHKQFPTIAGMVWRESTCHRSTHGKCAHLIVLAFDGQLHHVHVPSKPIRETANKTLIDHSTPVKPSRLANINQVSIGRGDHHAPPASSHSRSSSLTNPTASNAVPAINFPRGSPISATKRSRTHERSFSTVTQPMHTSISSSHNSKSNTSRDIATYSGIRLLHGRRPNDVSTAQSMIDDTDAQSSTSNPTGIKRRRSQKFQTAATVSDTHVLDNEESNPDDVLSSANSVAFSSIAYDTVNDVIVIASISLSPERDAHLSFWKCHDQQPNHFTPWINKPLKVLMPSSSAVHRQPLIDSLRRCFKRARITVGLDDEQSAYDDDEFFTPTLSDITSYLSLSPSGSRVSLLDVQGNLNVWSVDHDTQTLELIHTIRRVDPSPVIALPNDASLVERSSKKHTRHNIEDGREVLLCQATWWNDDVIALSYSNYKLLFASISQSIRAAEGGHMRRSSSFGENASPLISVARNLLGDSPFQFAGIPFLTQATTPRLMPRAEVTSENNQPSVQIPHCILILECEQRFQRKRKVWSKVSAETAPSASQLIDSAANQDDEHITFSPVYRLLALEECSPLQFMQRHLDRGEFDQAKQLANHFHLNTDLVYQNQWKQALKSSMDMSYCIDHYLRHVSDISWALNECAVHQPYEASQHRVLLQFGLTLTDSANNTPRSTQLNETSAQLQVYRLLFTHQLDRLATYEALQRLVRLNDNEMMSPTSKSSSLASIKQIFPISNLSFSQFVYCNIVDAAKDFARDEQIEAVDCLLVHHPRETCLIGERLAIIEEIPVTADPARFVHLFPISNQPICSSEAFSDRDDILSLPVLQKLADLFSEFPKLKTTGAAPVDRLVDTLIQRHELLKQYSGELPSVGLLAPFAQARVSAMDRESGDFASIISLINQLIARDQYLRPALLPWLEAAVQLNELVLTFAARDVSPIQGSGLSLSRLSQPKVRAPETLTMFEVSLNDWVRMSLVQKFTRVMESSDDFTVVGDIVIGPGRVILGGLADRNAAPKLLQDWLKVLASSRRSSDDPMQRLSLIRRVAQATRSDAALTDWLPADSSLFAALLECCYRFDPSQLKQRTSSQPDEQLVWPALEDIVNAMPKPNDQSEAEQRDQIKREINAARILSINHFPVTLQAVHLTCMASSTQSIGQCPIDIEQMFDHLTHRPLRARPVFTDRQWTDLLTDLLTLRDLFNESPVSSVSLLDVYTRWLDSVLASGRFKLAKRVLRVLTGLEGSEEHLSYQSHSRSAAPTAEPKSRASRTGFPSLVHSINQINQTLQYSVPVEHSGIMPVQLAESLVLKVASELLDSATSVEHVAVELAQKCLSILPLQVATSALDTINQLGKQAISSAFSIGHEAMSGSSNQLSTPEMTAQWQSELELIDGLMRLQSLHVDVIPYQLRHSQSIESRLSFIDAITSQKPDTYKDVELMMDLASLFGCASDECQAAGRMKLIECALGSDDLETAYTLCLDLLEHRRYRPAYTLAARILISLNTTSDQKWSEQRKAEARHRLAGHAVWACQLESIDQSINQWKQSTLQTNAIEPFLQELESKEADWKEEKYDGPLNPLDSLFGEEIDDASQFEDVILGVFKQKDSDKLNMHLTSSDPSLLAYDTLSHADERDDPQFFRDRDSVLLALITDTYLHDLSLCVAYCLEISNTERVDRVIQHLLYQSTTSHQRSAALKLGVCVFTTRAYMATSLTSEPVIDMMFQSTETDGAVALQALQTTTENVEHPDIKLAGEYSYLLSRHESTLVVTSLLPALGASIDTAKFQRDAVYRESALCEVAGDLQRADGLELALQVATAMRVPHQPLHIAHATSLLLSQRSLTDVKQDINQSTEQLLKVPSLFYNHLVQIIFPQIDGTDYERLRYMFSLCEQCIDAMDQTNKTSKQSSSRFSNLLFSLRSLVNTHVQVLETLSKAGISVDYHRLIDRESFKEELARVIEEQNFLLVSRLAGRLNELVLAPAFLPVQVPDVASSTNVPPSPSRPQAQQPALITSSFIIQLFLAKSLTVAMNDASFSADTWIDRNVKNFGRLSFDHARELIEQVRTTPHQANAAECARLAKVLDKYAKANQQEMQAST